MGFTLPLELIGYIVDSEILTTRVLKVVNFGPISFAQTSFKVTFPEHGYPNVCVVRSVLAILALSIS